MTHELILTETRGRVGIIKFNRPEKLNALSNQMREETQRQIGAWNDDDGIGAIVLTGEGRAFCSGADLDDFSDRAERNKGNTPASIRTGRVAAPVSVTDAYNLPAFLQTSKPLIAAVNGYSVGVGLTFILPFDVRIASTKALFSIRFIRVGLIPELGSTRILAQIVGLGNATDMCLSGRMVNAEEALRMGLVTQVAEPGDLLDTAVAKANEIANNPPGAVMLIKELLRKNPLDGDLERVMEREGIRDQIAQRHPDHPEALAAFLEKRPARFGQSKG